MFSPNGKIRKMVKKRLRGGQATEQEAKIALQSMNDDASQEKDFLLMPIFPNKSEVYGSEFHSNRKSSDMLKRARKGLALCGDAKRIA